MKRFLSLILAMVMLISFVPVYAAPAEGGSEIKVVYDFTSFEGAANGAVTNSLVTSYKNSYGFWKYSSSGNNRGVPLKLVKDQKTGQNVLCVYCGAGNTIDNDSGETATKKIADFYFAYEIYVPKAGKYDITLENMQSAKAGALAQLFIFSASETVTYTALKEEWESDEKEHFQGSPFSYCNTDLTNEGHFTSASEDLGSKYFEKGKYVVVFAAVDKQAGINGYANCLMAPMKLILNGGDGAVPMKMSIEALHNEIAEVSILMSDNTLLDLTGATIKWSSSDPSVVSVDNDGFVEFLKLGEASIKAEVPVGGNNYTVEELITVDEVPLPVPCADAIQTYNFMTTKLSDYSDNFVYSDK